MVPFAAPIQQQLASSTLTMSSPSLSSRPSKRCRWSAPLQTSSVGRTRRPPPTLHKLPDNVLEHVFEQLAQPCSQSSSTPRAAGPSHSHVSALAGTCSRFSLYYRLDYVRVLDLHATAYSLPSQDAVTRALRRFPRIHTLLYPSQSSRDLPGGACAAPSGRGTWAPFAPCGTRLPRSALMRNPFWAVASFAACARVRTLHVDVLLFEPRALRRLLGSLSELRQLCIVYADVDLEPGIEPLSMKRLVDGLLQSVPPSVCELTLTTEQLSRSWLSRDYSIAALTPARLPKLLSLYMSSVEFGKGNYEALSQLRSLETLDVRGDSLRNAWSFDLAAFSRTLVPLKALKVLVLKQVGRRGVAHCAADMCMFLESLPKDLVSLTVTLGMNNLHEVCKTVQLPPDCFLHLKQLCHLSLGTRGLNRQSWKHLLKAVPLGPRGWKRSLV